MSQRKRNGGASLAPTPDLDIENHGSVVLLRPRSDAGSEWIRESCDAPAWAWQGGALAIEPRMVEPIVVGARDAGLVVRGESL